MPCVQQPNRILRRGRTQVHVALRGREIRVPRELLDGARRRASHRQVRTERVPQDVGPPKLEPPKEKKPKQKHASLASAPTRADQQVDRPAAPMPGLSSRNSDALPNWKTQLVAKLERSKRYPSEARGDQGIAQLAFSVDRQGGVHNARIVRSSGSSVLDHETLALVQRAQPLPPPPPEVSGAQIPIVVPIRYNAR